MGGQNKRNGVFLPTLNKKLGKIYETTVFRHWTTGSKRLIAEGKKENKKDKLYYRPSLLPEGRLQAAARK